MKDLWLYVERLLTSERVLGFVTAGLVLIVGWLLARAAGRGTERLVARRFTAQNAMIAGRVVHYLALGLVFAVALKQAGLDLSILLGAAGVLTVALGFASQTSASNLISGLFLMGEAPFKVGDVIRIGATTGEVRSIDLLSVKLRTFDNLLVRLPNETLLKTEITNLTRFPIRRFDALIGVAYKEDVRRVHQVLMEVADRNPLCLEEPKPVFIFQGFGDSSLNLQFSVWSARENYLEVKTRIQQEIKEAFDAADIEIPFPHRSLYAGSVSEPFQVRLVDRAPDAPAEAGGELQDPVVGPSS